MLLLASQCRGCVLVFLNLLHTAKPLLALIKDSINGLQQHATQNVELEITLQLNAAVLPDIFSKESDFLASNKFCSPRAFFVFESSSVDHSYEEEVS